MNILLIVLSLAGGLVIGLLVLLVVVRTLAERQTTAQEAAVAAAVSATLIERDATAAALERDREALVSAAVSQVVEVADAKLEARMRQGTEQLDASNQALCEQTTNINAELRRMQKMLTDQQERAAGQHGDIVRGLENAAKVTSQLQSTAGGLREALASPKARGQWGERMAEDVLRAMGFKEGINFERQRKLPGGGIPDITFLLPKGMVMHMDVKFPLDNYLRHLELVESDAPETEAEEYRTRFRKDAKTKVVELSVRGYADSVDSIDYVILFIPIESVYSFVQENDPGLLDFALRSKVLLCGPSTLFGSLAIVRQAMDNFMLERRGDDIMECLANFSAEWEKFSEHVDKVGKHLGTAQNAFDQLASTRTNQMQRQLRRIDEIQAQREVGADPDDDWPALEVIAG